MKSELQVQLETALLGKLKDLCRILKEEKIELGSPEMYEQLKLARLFWIDGTKYVMIELAAEAESISLEEVKALTDEGK